ncbi:MAG: hypothetical protein V1977_05225 [Candidatus Diapherotrites archaeon]
MKARINNNKKAHGAKMLGAPKNTAFNPPASQSETIPFPFPKIESNVEPFAALSKPPKPGKPGKFQLEPFQYCK